MAKEGRGGIENWVEIVDCREMKTLRGEKWEMSSKFEINETKKGKLKLES